MTSPKKTKTAAGAPSSAASLSPKRSPALSLESWIKPTQKQQQFLRAIAEHRFVLYGGAMGGGKSYILRWALVWWLMQLAGAGVTNANVGLFCEDYPSLYDRHISKIRFEFPPELGQLREGTTRDFVLRPEWGGGRIALRNLEDPAKYQSAEFAAIAVDELTKNDQTIFDFLRTRLRWPGVDRPRFLAATNPGGIGHAWVKALWLDQKIPAELAPLAHEFVFVQALARDNPHLTEAYYHDLQTLPPTMAKAFADGNWNVFAGQFFDIFDPLAGGRHVVRPETIEWQPWWPRWISIDWGFEHPAAVYWHTMDDHRRIITYREFVQNRLSPRMLAQAIVERSQESEVTSQEKIQQAFLSPDAFARHTSESTVAEQMGDVFAAAGLPRPVTADNDRVGGWMLMYQLLESHHWLITSNCENLIASLPTLVRDEVHVEDIAKVAGDDPADAARYGLKSRFHPAKKPLESRVLDRLAEMPPPTSPTGHAMQMQRALYDEKKRFKPVFVRGELGHKWRT